MVLLQLNNIEKTYSDHDVLRGVSFQMRHGDRIGLVGGNGAGKSTLLKIINGEEVADGGQFHLARDIKVGYLSQKPEFSSDALLRDYLEAGMRDLITLKKELSSLEEKISAAARQGHGDDSSLLAPLLERYGRLSHLFEERDGYNLEHRLKTVTQGLGFSDAELERPLDSFSGGEKTRAQLAVLLLQEPDLLLLDEPTNNLDMETVEWLESILAAWQGALLVVSHDRFFLDRVVTSVVLLEAGVACSYRGNYSAYQAKRRHEEEAAFKAYRKQAAELEKERSFILNASADERTKKQARSREKRLQKMAPLEEKSIGPSIKIKMDFAGRSGKLVAALENVTKYYGELEVFSVVNFEINWGDRVAVVGPNGAGKTTLLRLISGEELPSRGRLKVGPAVRIAYFDQEQRKLDLNSTPLQVIMEDAGMDTREARNYLGSYLFRGDEVFKKVGALSGGEISRLALAKVGLVSGNFLIMDEPTNHLDIKGVEELETTLVNYPGTLLVVSHDRYFISRTAGSILEVRDGQVALFPMGYEEYRELKAEAVRTEEAEARGERAGKSSFVKNEEKVSRRKRQEQEKAERQAILEARRRRRDVQQRLDALEEKIEEREAEVAALQEKLADPSIYDCYTDVRLLTDELLEVRKQVEGLYQEWEKTAAQLEETPPV